MDFVDVGLDIKVDRWIVERVGLAFKKSKSASKHVEQTIREDSTERSVGKDVDIDYLMSLDPKEWKDQDHYAVLGLESLRFSATDDDIRRSFRKMVLLHHPDKRKAKGEEIDTENDYFTCITKAYEILGTPKTRRAYDSVDPEFNNELPTAYEIENEFYSIFNKYFNLNARWSEKKNVPEFGDENSKREDVDKFYSFWYDFKSWREYSYLDEEDKEKGQDRDERRWIDKENKAARIKRKKEEMQRIRTLVDLAYNNDKRIQKFKMEEKERKLAAKRAKMDAAQAQRAEQERVQREVQLAKERAEKAEQKRIEQIRIEKEQMKKAMKKEKKTLRDRAKESNYYGDNDKDMLKNMEGVEKICEIFSLTELQELNKEMSDEMEKDAFMKALIIAEAKIRAEQEKINQAQQRKAQKSDGIKVINKNEIWNNENLQLLIKAVNLFPAGTIQRWDVIASFINQHSTNATIGNVTARDVLNKAKALQSGDFSKSTLKTQANSDAFEKFEKSKKDVQTCSDITVNNYNDHVTTNGGAGAVNNNNNVQNNNKDTAGGSSNTNSGPRAWTTEEQILLEQAIKTYDSSTPDRWDRIAACIPNRSKKDCLRRVKELVDRVNSKKEAQQSVK